MPPFLTSNLQLAPVVWAAAAWALVSCTCVLAEPGWGLSASLVEVLHRVFPAGSMPVVPAGCLLGSCRVLPASLTLYPQHRITLLPCCPCLPQAGLAACRSRRRAAQGALLMVLRTMTMMMARQVAFVVVIGSGYSQLAFCAAAGRW